MQNDLEHVYILAQLKQLVQAYIEELKWRDENYIPETLSEHLGLSMRSSGGAQILCSSLVGMGEIVTRETLDWFLSYPQLVRSFDTFVRLSDDMASTEVLLHLLCISVFICIIFILLLHLSHAYYCYFVLCHYLSRRHLSNFYFWFV